MASSSPSLARHPQFLKLWVGQTISVFGSRITLLALPLTAVLLLNATPTQMGVLNAMGMVPYLLVGLFAGVWVDRVRRRPVLIGADLGRFMLLAAVPLTALAGILSMPALYIIILAVGILTVFFDFAYEAFLPALVGSEKLVEGNSKLAVSSSAASLLGPGFAGLLIQVLTAPIAILFDALSFLASAVMVSLIRVDEAPPPPRDESRGVFRDMGDGLRFVLGNRMLWSIAASTGTALLFFNLWDAVYIIYLTRELHIAPLVQGFIFAAGAPGALLAAVFGSRVTQRLGFGRVLIGGMLLYSVAQLLVLVQGPLPVVVGFMVVSGFLSGFGSVMYNVNLTSLRQTITPNHLLGRVGASMSFIIAASIPVGALIGGALGDAIGLHPTMVIGTTLGLLAVVWLYFSPARHARSIADFAAASEPTADDAPSPFTTKDMLDDDSSSAQPEPQP